MKKMAKSSVMFKGLFIFIILLTGMVSAQVTSGAVNPGLQGDPSKVPMVPAIKKAPHPGLPGVFIEPAEKRSATLVAGAQESSTEYGDQITSTNGGKWYTNWSYDGEWITYSESKGDGYDVFIVPYDGGEPVNLTPDIPGDNIFPSFRPNSNKVTFTNVNDGKLDVVEVHIDTKDVTLVLANAANGRWSHNGRYLAYNTGDEAIRSIFDAQENTSWVLTDEGGYGVFCFTPDDNFVITTMNDNNLYRIPIDGGTPHRLTYSEGQHWYPNVTPDGKWLMYTFWPQDVYVDGELYVMNLDTGEEEPVFSGLTSQNYAGSFSPDGSQLAYLNASPGNYEVYVANAQFGDSTPDYTNYGLQLTGDTSGKWYTDYSNKGNYITYSSLVDRSKRDIFLLQTDGSEPVNLTSGIEGNCTFPSFIPYTTKITFTNSNNGLSIWEVNFQTGEASLVLENAANGRWSHNGMYMAFRNGESGTLSIFDKTDNKTYEIDNDGSFGVSCFTTDDQYVITTRGDSALWKVPVKGGAPEQITPYAGYQWYPNTTIDGKWVTMTIWPEEIFVDSFLAAYNLETSEFIAIFPFLTSQNYCASFSGDGMRMAYLRSVDGTYQVFDVESPVGVGKSLEITYPWTDSEVFEVGQTYTIKWDASGLQGNLLIQYRTDSNAQWNEIATDIDPATGSYDWTVPDTPSENCNIVIRELAVSAITRGKQFSIRSSSQNTLTLKYPLGGERFEVGQTVAVEWEYEGSNTIAIEYSLDNGQSWHWLSTNQWIIPDTASTECLVRVREDVSGGLVSKSNSPFTIYNPAGDPYVTVLSPNGGEVWEVGKTYDITWDSKIIKNFHIRFSSDSMESMVISDVIASVGKTTWTVPEGFEGKGCSIYIVDRVGGAIGDGSDNTFTIVSDATESSITLLHPNGFEELGSWGPASIRWKAVNLPKIDIWYSADSGINWIEIARGVDATKGEYIWDVPSTLDIPECYIWVGDPNDDTINDTNDDPFAIVHKSNRHLRLVEPNSSVEWAVGSEQRITWEVDEIHIVTILYTTDDGTNWETIATDYDATKQSYLWTIPDTPSDQCRVRIIDGSHSGVEYTSFSKFTIYEDKPEPYLRIISPNGGEDWVVGTEQLITWEARDVSMVTIEFSIDEGSSWNTIDTNVSADRKSLSWTIPEMLSDKCRVRIIDEASTSTSVYLTRSYANFSITQGDTEPYLRVVTPSGNETLEVGQTYTITWEARNVDTVKLVYTVDDDLFWKQIYTQVDASHQSVEWTVPDFPSSECRIGIINEANTDHWVMSYATFTITRPNNEPWVRLVQPNGFEEWQAGTTQSIQWESRGDMGLSIQLSLDGGDSWDEIASNVPSNSGEFNWEIPTDIASSTCRLWVGDLDSPDRNDFSERAFTITESSQDERSITLHEPFGGQQFLAGSEMTVKWTAVNVSTVEVVLVWNDWGSFYVINESLNAGDGELRFVIPDDINDNDCYIWIGNDDEGVETENENPFSILQSLDEPSITLLDSFDGQTFMAGTGFRVAWSSVNVEKVDIYLAWNGWESFNIVIENYDASVGELSFNLPGDIDSDDCYIWVGDSDNDEVFAENSQPFRIFHEGVMPLINVTLPTDGDVLEAGQTYEITWESQGVSRVRIHRSSPLDRFPLLIDIVDAASGSYMWTINKFFNSNDVKIMIVDEGNADISGESGSFSVIPPQEEKILTLWGPNGGEELAVNQHVEIEWEAIGIEKINIEISTDGGNSWTPLFQEYDATEGYMPWQVTDTVSTQCLVRISDSSNPNLHAVSASTFTIFSGEVKASIRVTYPNGGQVLNVGDEVEIRWNSTDVDKVNMRYSTQGGEDGTWTLIAFGVNAALNSYTWTVPDEISENCYVRISNADDFSIIDINDEAFSIAKELSNDNAFFRIDTDLGSAGWQAWAPVSGVGADELVAFAIYGRRWVAPDLAQFTMTWDTGAATFRQDLSLFKTNGESLTVNGAETTLPQEENVMAHFGGTPDTAIQTLADGVVQGTIFLSNEAVPSDQSGLVYLAVFELSSEFSSGDSLEVSVSMNINDSQGVRSLGDRIFEAQASTAYITVTAPVENDLWEAGSLQTIWWESQGVNEVAVVLSTVGYSTNAEDWESISGIIDANEYSGYEWTIPDNIDSDSCVVALVSMDEDVDEVGYSYLFSIYKVEKDLNLASPNGGQEWTARAEEEIAWTATGITLVDLEYSVDGGTTWKPIESGVDATLGSYNWSIPIDASTTCKVRITDASDSSITDESDFDFSIVSGSFVSVNEPSGGVTWSSGIEYEIRWDFAGITSLKIEYSTDGGENWLEAVASVSASDGSYPWKVPDVASSECIVRLTDTTDSTQRSSSDIFTIAKPEISIEHNAFAEQEENAEIEFEANVTSDSEISEVMIYYDDTGNRKFDHQLTMQATEGDKYQAVLSEGTFTALGMEYYISAKDSEGKTTRSPIDGDSYHDITALVTDIRTDAPVTGGSAQTSYRMVSIPLELNSTDIVTQLTDRLPTGVMGEDWRIFRYPSGSDLAAEYPDIEGFQPGNAFWIIAKTDYNFMAPQGKTVSTAESFRIELKSGWNDIANPWMFDISWSDIEDPSGAKEEGNISVLYTYNGTWSDPTNPPTKLEPWKGYAVKNLSNRTVIIKLTPKPAGVGKRTIEPQLADWKISIEAAAGLAGDTANHLGVMAEASVEWDRFDHVEPPAVGEYVSVMFPHRDWMLYPHDYTVDFRPPASTQSWNFDVKTNIANELVSVDLAGIDDLPSGHTLLLFDRDTGKEVTLSGTGFEFKSADDITVRRFSLVVTTEETIDQPQTDVMPEQFVTAHSYPNPFNPQTTIRYELSKPGYVKLSIYNAVGQRARNIDLGFRNAGGHDYLFDANDLTTGLYIVRVDAGYAVATEKMLFMK
ncbi:T9SS type A sorting domain-containing protein [Candidatus Latescibacterota bacterium]